ncbi:MAG: hypothetical protein EBV28_09520 [Betaproteobacteria bacterium]|nr:hypothetical protein [Betaproteobacteria bacterium]
MRFRASRSVWRKDFTLLLLCLRLAVLCCHGRHQAAKVKLHVKRDRQGEVELSWGQDARERRLTPAELRTQHLLREEVAVWAKAGLLRLRWAD